MSIFNGKRLSNEIFRLNVPRLREGYYTDKYFLNNVDTLAQLAHQNYRFQGQSPRLNEAKIDASQVDIGNIEVEAQWFTRRKPHTLIVGVDQALSILRHCTGYFDEAGGFVETWQNLSVEALEDGDLVAYNGDASQVKPVLRVRGRYRDFAALETATLGVLSRASRVASNVYHVLKAAQGKPVLFFPARFDLPEVQSLDGYAYYLAIQRYNQDYGADLSPAVSTDAQGAWWGGQGGGTIAHAAIASCLGDTVETLLTFSATQPANIPRVALVDFHNDSIGTGLAVLKAMFSRYQAALKAGNEAEAEKYKLFGVRLDTSGSLRDVSLPPLGDKKLDHGVNPRLVWKMRQALDTAWQSWNLSAKNSATDWQDRAKDYCQQVKIVVSGGFNVEKITRFEDLGVPVDVYGVGSSLFSNDASHGTNTDFTMDIVKVKINGQWVDMAKVGRQANENPALQAVDLANL